MPPIRAFERIRLVLRRSPPCAILALLVLHGIIAAAGFVAPYSVDAQNRELPFAPPARIHFMDTHHGIHLRPFLYRSVLREGTIAEYQEDRTTRFPLHFLVTGSPYKWFGLFPSSCHLFGVAAPARLFLLGSDAYGRDEFSRLLFGGQISLFSGLLAAAIALCLGAALGGLAGYYESWVDEILMRVSEIFMSVPWLYLLLCMRAFLPLHMKPDEIFLLLLIVLGGIGWARPARLIRGVVRSAKHRDYVRAACGFGASDLYVIRKHVLPAATAVAFTQLALYIPQYVLAEVTLSFFGIGISEPAPSWGNMLAAAQHDFVILSCWWLLAPAAALVAIFLGYHKLFSRYSARTATL